MNWERKSVGNSGSFHETWKIGILFCLLWFGILMGTGTLSSGYHLTDDQDLLRIGADLAGTTLGREIRIFLKGIFAPALRFRPVFELHRRVMTVVLGTDFTAWSIYFGILAVLTSFFLFLFLRKTGFSIVEALLFAVLTLLGEQAALWWKLGTNETIGMFILSLALLFMALSVDSTGKKKKILYETLFIFFTILASWCKESFILMIPALVAWKIWLTHQKSIKSGAGSPNLLWPFGPSRDSLNCSPQAINPVRRTPTPTQITNTNTRIRPLAAGGKNIISTVILLVICCLELLHIVKSIGTAGIQYAGYEGFRLSTFIVTGLRSFLAVHGWILGIELAVLFFCLRRPGGFFLPEVTDAGDRRRLGLESDIESKQTSIGSLRRRAPGPPQNFLLEKLLGPLVIGLLVVVPQIVLYMKSGMIERYLLPGIMGYTFLMIVFLRSLRESSGEKEKKYFGKSWPEVVVLLVLAVVFLQQLRVTRYTASAFAFNGKQLNAWFQSLEQHTGPQDLLLIVTQPQKYFEASVSLKAYLNIEMKREKVLFSPASLTIEPSRHTFWHHLNQGFFSVYPGFRLGHPGDRERIRGILIFPGLEKAFLEASADWFDPAYFERYTNAAGYVSYYRNPGEQEKNKRETINIY
jgi:hypothetical protein